MLKLLVLAALVSSGCQLDLEVDEVRLTYRNIAVKGVPGGGNNAFKHGVAFDDLAALRDLVDQGAEVAFIGAALHATDGVDDMTFVDELQISIASADAAATIPPLVVYGCEASCDARGRDVVMKPDKKQRATEYLASGSLLLDLDLAGKLPGKDWTLDIDVVLEANLEYTLDPRQ